MDGGGGDHLQPSYLEDPSNMTVDFDQAFIFEGCA